MKSNRWLSAIVPALFIAAPALAATAWQADTYYVAGTVVAYNRHDYKALVNQTDYATTGWNPTNASLWTDLGPSAGSTPSPTPSPTATPTPKPSITPVQDPTVVPTQGPSPTPKPTGVVTTPTPPAVTPIVDPVWPTPAVNCYSTWTAGITYNGGDKVSLNGVNYVANWWTQSNPSTNNGPAGSGKDWTVISTGCGVTTTPTPKPITPTPTSVPPTATPTPAPTIPTATQIVASKCPGQAPFPTWTAGTNYTVGTAVNPRSNTLTVHYGGSSTYPGVFVVKQAHLASAANEPQSYGSLGAIYDATLWDVAAVFPAPCATPTPTPVPTPTPNPAKITAVTVDTWKGGATGAYSMLHDDLCAYITDGQINYADPELVKRGLVAAFGIISGNCAPYHWTAAQTFISHGHEIYSHTRNHYDSNTANWVSSVEIAQSAQDIATNLNGYQVSYFAWPSDIAPDAPLAYLRSQANYIGGRAPNRVDASGTITYGQAVGVNSANFTDPYEVQWDLFTNSGQWSLYPQGSEILNLHVDAAIAQGGWATRTMHGVNDTSYESVPLARYQAHLDYVKTKVDAGLLWVATPSNVIRYRFARQYCVPTLATDGHHIDFSATDPQCVKYATPITLELTLTGSDASTLFGQGGKALPAKSLGNGHYRVDVLPTAGSVTMSSGL
ncbi:carbohydrate-binding protein [Andreprevotia chitinilytica]|uniref:carbohydrate-binding protein n=1 Tax=Andreprevotia chitinilytica TaxID=396808 RepID=UPI00068EDEAD|nr:carbohydrate-binding protein [Andreprevotia chitinilytica]